MASGQIEMPSSRLSPLEDIASPDGNDARMRRTSLPSVRWLLLSLVIAGPARGADEVPSFRLQARIVAVGLPGVAGVRQIGRFHVGGPIPGNPEFLLQTDPGRVLDPQRVMVAVASNFGASAAMASAAPGAVLSIDPRGAQALIVPADFARLGGQASALAGAVQVYSAQSAAFLNARFNPGARTSSQTAVAGPRYISINNAFGRPWIANAPQGPASAGSLSVVDPGGAPLANAPSDDAGGVFLGDSTARRQVPRGMASTWLGRAFNYRSSAQLTPGSMATGALGTAFLGASPDGGGFAVFAVATADGAIAQVHVQDGVDGLLRAGTLAPGDDAGGVVGMAFQWSPDKALFVTDSRRDRVLLIHLTDDRRQFKVARQEAITSAHFKCPIDISPAIPEIGNAAFASLSTLAGGSDLYVANRGDGSLLRLNGRGGVLAKASIELPGGGLIAGDRLRALAVSADAQTIWLTVQGELPGFAGREGALIEVSAFDDSGAFTTTRRMTTVASRTPNAARDAAGIFERVFTPGEGLGPLFNEQSCAACHPGGGSSPREEHFARRVARMDEITGRVLPIEHPNSPVARRRSTREWGVADAAAAELPRQANVMSLRMPMGLFNSAAIERVADSAIVAQATSKGDGIKGRVAYVQSAGGQTRIGRWGWKADFATLEEMTAEALSNELGITSALAVQPVPQPKDDGRLVRAAVDALRGLSAPARSRP